MASHDGISPVGVGGKRIRIPAEDPEEVRRRDKAYITAKVGASRPSGHYSGDKWNMNQTEYFGDNTARALEEFDCD